MLVRRRPKASSRYFKRWLWVSNFTCPYCTFIYSFYLLLELNPTPSEEICQNFNELRSDMVLLMELKAALSTCEYELQSLRHQYEAVNPGKTLTIPPQLLSSIPEQDSTKQMSAAEIIDVVGSPGTPSGN